MQYRFQMLLILSAILFFKAISLFAQDEIPQIPPLVIKRMKALQYTDPVNTVAYSSSTGLIVSKRYKETMQLFRITKPGGKLEQLTYDTNPIFNAEINPDSARHSLLFEKDNNGDEINQIYKFDLRSKSINLLTDGVSQNGNCIWSNKGDKFAFASTMKNSKDWGIYISSIDPPRIITPVIEKRGDWGINDWSPDDSSLLISQFISSNESRYYLINLNTHSLTALFGSDTEKMSIDLGKYSKNGKGIFFTSDESTEQQILYYYDLSTGRKIPLTKDIPWNVREYTLSQDSTKLAFGTNENGFSKFYIMLLKDFSIRQLKDIPQGIISRFHFSSHDSLIIFTFHKPSETDAIYSINIYSEQLTKWTKLKNPDVSDIPPPEIIHYPTFDSVNSHRRTIPCFFYKPAGKGPFPVVVSIHGGPESQYWPYYSPLLSYILKYLHCAVLAPNVRGSNGYGKTWLSLDDGYKRENSVKDIGALLDWVESQSTLDKSRVAVMGGSYGGFMSLASMVAYGNRLKAGIDLYGISNFITFMQKTKSSRVDLRRVEYGDERDSSMNHFLHDISPLTNVDKIKKPMLIIQGANDARVPAYESEQIVGALKKNKIPVWYLLFSDEGHGFNKKNNKDYEENVIGYFLEKFLIN